ncbi:MAG: hypothetical protein WA796_26130 [Pseudolabrys sp.]|jgi:hypothetical protein
MRRREFIGLLANATVLWPQVARAQQLDRMKRVGWLSAGLAENDPESKARKTTKVAADAVTGTGGISPIQDQNVILSMQACPRLCVLD